MEEVEKKNIIAGLGRLSRNPGYKYITKILKEGVEIIEKKLHGESPLDDRETMKELQGRRLDRVKLLEMPKRIIKDLETLEAGAEPDDLDPYF